MFGIATDDAEWLPLFGFDILAGNCRESSGCAAHHVSREISVREHHFGIDDVVYTSSADSGDLELTTDKCPRGILYLANHHAEKPLSRTSSQR